MLKTVGVTELQRQLRSILDEVVGGNTPYILTRDSKPEAVIVSYDAFMRLQALQEQDVLRRVDDMIRRLAESNAEYDEAYVAAEVEAAVQEVRKGLAE
jgi:prevent-host-death family protein